jgi:hypothetical protein
VQSLVEITGANAFEEAICQDSLIYARKIDREDENPKKGVKTQIASIM